MRVGELDRGLPGRGFSHGSSDGYGREAPVFDWMAPSDWLALFDPLRGVPAVSLGADSDPARADDRPSIIADDSGFAATIDLASLDGITGFRIDGVDANDGSGLSVASAGDVNGDGFADMIIGATGADPDSAFGAGESYVVFGKAGGFAASFDLSTLDGTNGFRLDGIDGSDGSGRPVASAGDVNGDGFDDIIIGATGADPGGDSQAGESYVVFGKSSGFGASLDLAALNGSNGFRIDGIDASDFSGASVASAGDVNGDGFDDIVIGAYGADRGGAFSVGESYVIFGKSSGFAASLDLAALNGSNGFRIDGIDAGDFSGISVASAGDVNGDGFDDIIVGASSADPGGDTAAGESYVIFGKSSGFAASLDLAALDGSNGFRIDGIDAVDKSGYSVASAGDVNGDGFDDIVIGAHYADPGGDKDAGESYVIFGKGSGFGATLDLATLDGSNGFRIDGMDLYDLSGLSVASAGDVNGDGFDDIIVGASVGDPGGDSSAGESYVIFGKSSGFAASLDLAALDGTNGFRLDGIDANDLSGRSVASAGDVNGDGFADIIIGASGGDPGGHSGAGESYVIFGRMPQFAVTRIGSVASQFISGGLGNDVIEGRAGDDTLNGQDGDDIVRGGIGDDSLLGGAGDDDLDGGSSDDTIEGGSGSDQLTGGAGDDDFDGGSGDDMIEGGSGADQLTGGSGNDTLEGGADNDVIFGGTGNDTVDGQGGNDRLNGNDGLDLLRGGAGNDVLVDKSGGDTLDGGQGDDKYIVADQSVMVIEAASEGYDTIKALSDYILPDNVEELILPGGGDLNGTGNDLDNGISGFGGDNVFDGRGGDDLIFSRGGADTLNGDGGNDTLRAGGGSDLLDGGSGDDKLFGEKGFDTLTGGSGVDQFVFRDDDQFDTITDFEDGIDRINLADYREENGGSALTFDQLLITQNGTDTKIELDLDRNGIADVIDLDGDGTGDAWRVTIEDFSAGALTATDFIL